MNRDRGKLVLFAIAMIWGLGCGEQPRPSLPEQLAGARRVRLELGRAARNRLEQMHRGVDLAAYRTGIATYRGVGTEIVVYVVVFEDSAAAEKMMAAMSGNIQAGKAPAFSYRGAARRSGLTVHQVTSGSQMHYLFQRGKTNVWITVTGDRPEAVLDDFLDQFDESQ